MRWNNLMTIKQAIKTEVTTTSQEDGVVNRTENTKKNKHNRSKSENDMTQRKCSSTPLLIPLSHTLRAQSHEFNIKITTLKTYRNNTGKRKKKWEKRERRENRRKERMCNPINLIKDDRKLSAEEKRKCVNLISRQAANKSAKNRKKFNKNGTWSKRNKKKRKCNKNEHN